MIDPMIILQNYGKEIVALVVPLITWWLHTFLRSKARLNVATPHSFTFLVQQPLIDHEGKQISPTQTVHTNSFIVYNSGREPATKLELVFNWKPMCLNLWPMRHFEEHTEPDGRYVLIFPSLSPNETLGCETLSVNADLPNLITVRSDQCVAQFINMYPQPVVGPTKKRIHGFLLAAGLAAVVYGFIVLIQLLVLKTPIRP